MIGTEEVLMCAACIAHYALRMSHVDANTYVLLLASR